MSKIDLGITITGFNNSTSAIRGASGDVKQLGENAQATSNRLKAIQVVIAGILIDKTLEYSKAIVQAMASTQGLDLRMQAFAGSAKNADDVMTDLLASFGGAPFKIDTLSASWTRLRASVKSNEQVMPVLKAIVDDVAAMGGKDENVNNLAESFQRIFAVGTASAREYKTILQQTGLTLGDLAKAAGTTSTALEGDLKNGFENSQKFVDAFVKASNQRFGFFAQNLKGSVAGSISFITNSISAGISHIGATTDVNARVSAFFQNLAGAITRVMNSINQTDIDHFFKWLQEMQPLIQKTIVGLVNIATAIFQVATVLGDWIGRIPADTLEYGIIGYALFGKKAAAILMILSAVKKLMGEPDLVDMFRTSKFKTGPDGNILRDKNGKPQMEMSPLPDWLNNKPGSNPFGNLLPTPQQIADTQKMLSGLLTTFKGNTAAGEDMSYQMQLALEASENFATQLNAQLQVTKDKISEMNFKSNGDELGAELAAYTQQGDQFNKQLADAEVKYSNLKLKTHDAYVAISQMRDTQGDFNRALDLAKQKTTELFNIETARLNVSSMLLQTQNNAALHQLAMQSNNDAGFNMLQGTGAASALKSFQDQQLQYQQQILGIKEQLKALDAQMMADAASPERLAADQANLQSLTNLQGATRNALAGLTVEGQMAKQFWQSVGQTLDNDVANGLTGLINGTATLGDVARSVFTDMIGLAVKYLLQLVEMQLFGDAMQAAALGSTAAMAAASAALWAPAAVAASIATLGSADVVGVAAYQAAMATSIIPFANGGVPGLGSFENSVMSGPTLFGMGGEAGDEAVMPLTRIGGKLGVRSSGGGGDVYEIHVHAVDTQTGMQFISKHINDIDSKLQHKRRLNRGT